MTPIGWANARGIGRHLMDIIIAYGRGIGLCEIRGNVLTDNALMLALCRALGFRRASVGEGTIRARLTLT